MTLATTNSRTRRGEFLEKYAPAEAFLLRPDRACGAAGILEVEDSRSYYKALQKAGAPSELHTFAHGGRAFGLRAKGPIGRWPQLAEQWMHRIGMRPF